MDVLFTEYSLEELENASDDEILELADLFNVPEGEDVRNRVIQTLEQLDLIRDPLFIRDTPRSIQKSCRCSLDVAEKQPLSCNYNKSWGQEVEGVVCRNPDEVCETKGHCSLWLDPLKFSDLQLRAYVSLLGINPNGKNRQELIRKAVNVDLRNKIDREIYSFWFDNTRNPQSLFPQRSYPINRQKLQEYVDAQCTTDARMMASWIAELTKHITFNEFYTKLKSCIARFNKDIREVGKPYALIIPEKSIYDRKSSAWLFLLTLPLFNPQPTEIRTNIFNLKDISINQIVFIDDGIYSGDQLAGTIRDNFQDITIYEGYLEFIKDFRGYIISPFVSQYGMKRIIRSSSIVPITFYYETIMVPLKEQIIPLVARDLDMDLDSAKEWLNTNYPKIARTFKIKLLPSTNPIPIYFDHKLPDEWSSLPYVYKGRISTDRGNIINTSPHCVVEGLKYKVPFIEGCLNTDSNCPPAFYKKKH